MEAVIDFLAFLFSDEVVLSYWLLNGHDEDIRLVTYCTVYCLNLRDVKYNNYTATEILYGPYAPFLCIERFRSSIAKPKN